MHKEVGTRRVCLGTSTIFTYTDQSKAGAFVELDDGVVDEAGLCVVLHHEQAMRQSCAVNNVILTVLSILL